jgi:16S rRNA G1207 methylase RsmC
MRNTEGIWIESILNLNCGYGLLSTKCKELQKGVALTRIIPVV